MMSGRVLITGATGFVGQGLVAELTARSVPLTLAMRRAGDAKDSPTSRQVTVGEIGQGTDWSAALEGAGAVVHLAGHVHIAPERAEAEAALFDEVNVRGALRLFEQAAARGVPLFVFLSSITVMGNASPPGHPLTEASAPDATTPYARSKLAAEQTLVEAAAGSSTRLVILRPPLICGSGVKGNLARLIRLAKLPLPLPLGRIHNRRTLLALDNLVDAIRVVLERGRDAPAGTYVLGDRDPVSTSDIVRALREGLGRHPALLPAPVGLMRAGLAAAGAGGAAQRLFGDLEVDSHGFRQAFGWTDVTDTVSALRRAAADA